MQVAWFRTKMITFRSKHFSFNYKYNSVGLIYENAEEIHMKHLLLNVLTPDVTKIFKTIHMLIRLYKNKTNKTGKSQVKI